MRAVMPEALPDVLELRRRTGADRWDEMWEGVLHTPPMPNRMHQDLELQLGSWLRTHWARQRGNKVYPPINLALPGRWPNDYRIPDLVLLPPDRFHIDQDEYFDGAPTTVIEIRSPGDESLEKLPFYSRLGVPEVWIIDRDTREPEVYVLHEGEYRRKPPGRDGWIDSDATGIQLRAERGRRVAILIGGDNASLRLLPED
jgi:Uma2 family endonuclease